MTFEPAVFAGQAGEWREGATLAAPPTPVCVEEAIDEDIEVAGAKAVLEVAAEEILGSAQAWDSRKVTVMK